MSSREIKNCLVTGGAGFIGSHLVEMLLDQGYGVRVLDDFSSGSPDNLINCMDRIEVVEGDVRDFLTVRKATEDMDGVLHQAAIASVTRSIQEPGFTHDINVTGTVNVLEAARLCGVQKINIASSAAVYGACPVMPKQEGMTPAPVSPYGLHKLMGEQYGKLYAEQYGLQVNCFRYFNVYGMRQDPKSQYSGVISIFIDRVLSGKTPLIYGDGQQSRDFVSVTDICRANLLALNDNGFDFGVFNLGCDQAHTLLDILFHLGQALGKTIEPEYREERRGDLRHSRADITQAAKMLGYAPRVDFQRGLNELLDFTMLERGIAAPNATLQQLNRLLG